MDGDMAVASFFDRLRAHGTKPAIVEGDRTYGYGDMLAEVDRWDEQAAAWSIAAGDMIAVQSDFSLPAIAATLALFRRGCIVALLSPTARNPDMLVADIGASAILRPSDDPLYTPVRPQRQPALLDRFRTARRSGFVIFTSGSSGVPKAVLHDAGRFLDTYRGSAKPLVTLAFLLFDHIAGLDTLFYTLSAGGCLVLPAERTPRSICALIEQSQVEVLPTSPSFLKLLCLSGAADEFDLRSLRIVSFGSEPMPPATLMRLKELLPGVSLRQKYGASEFGAPRVKTRDGDALWIRIGDDRTSIRIENGLLWIRSPTTMVGYLNADAPVGNDGWFCTGDRVETDGEWIRILGRDSDLINVGGEKVSPSEVEAVIAELDCVAQVAVRGDSHPLLGQVVCAAVLPRDAEADAAILRRTILAHCLQRLQRHAVPTRIALSATPLVSERQKLLRRAALST